MESGSTRCQFINKHKSKYSNESMQSEVLDRLFNEWSKGKLNQDIERIIASGSLDVWDICERIACGKCNEYIKLKEGGPVCTYYCHFKEEKRAKASPSKNSIPVAHDCSICLELEDCSKYSNPLFRENSIECILTLGIWAEASIQLRRCLLLMELFDRMGFFKDGYSTKDLRRISGASMKSHSSIGRLIESMIYLGFIKRRKVKGHGTRFSYIWNTKKRYIERRHRLTIEAGNQSHRTMIESMTDNIRSNVALSRGHKTRPFVEGQDYCPVTGKGYIVGELPPIEFIDAIDYAFSELKDRMNELISSNNQVMVEYVRKMAESRAEKGKDKFRGCYLIVDLADMDARFNIDESNSESEGVERIHSRA